MGGTKFRAETASGGNPKGNRKKDLNQLVRIPPGDLGLDDPPIHLRNKRGENYYYQGEDNNCLVGGLANAVFWMCGSKISDQLLEKFIPIQFECWNLFVQHVHSCVPGYHLRKRVCTNVLEVDDSLPLVVQLRSCDQSDSHAICFYQGCIFDSASCFVLTKSKESLTWCCRMYGFEQHLRLYQLEKKDTQAVGCQKKKRRRSSKKHS